MLCKDRKDRLGQNDGVNEILAHPFFKGLDTQALLQKQIEAPFVPQIKDIKDIGNFDPEVTMQGLAESIVPRADKELVKKKADAFQGFGELVGDGLDSSTRDEGPGEEKKKEWALSSDLSR